LAVNPGILPFSVTYAIFGKDGDFIFQIALQ
jgi:hypothetical protein